MPWRRRRRAVASIPGRARSGRASERVRCELGGDLGQRGRIAAVRRIAVKLGSMMGPKKRIQGDSVRRKGSHTCGPCPSSHRQAQTNDAHIDSCRPARISDSLCCHVSVSVSLQCVTPRWEQMVPEGSRRCRATICLLTFLHYQTLTCRAYPKRLQVPCNHVHCRHEDPLDMQHLDHRFPIFPQARIRGMIWGMYLSAS